MKYKCQRIVQKNIHRLLLVFFLIFWICDSLLTSTSRPQYRQQLPKVRKQLRPSSRWTGFNIQMNAASDNSEESSSSTSKATNIDLFAAGPRKAPVQAVPPPPTTSSSPSKSSSSTSTITSAMSTKAELLRLEAEKEQLELDYVRIESEKKFLRDIDKLISSIMDKTVTLEKAIVDYKPFIKKEFYFRLAELANAGNDEV